MSTIHTERQTDQVVNTDVQNIDEEILALIGSEKSRDKGFRLLVQYYGEKIYWVVRRMVDSHEDSLDVVQNIWIKVHRYVDRFEGESTLYTWMYRIVINEAINFRKKNSKHKNTALNPSLHLIQYVDTIDGDRIEKLLHQAMKKLPERQLLVFNLRYFQELSYAEISEVVQVSEGSLKASYHHAVKKIEAYLKTHE